jgi:eukaryotic-like serine/threonine-protein kinase
MSLRKYLLSSVFFKQLVIAALIVVAILFLFLQWIGFSTNHGEEIVVPNLSKLNVEQAEERLDDANLDYVLLDTMDYDPNFPKFSVMKQDPLAGAKVKEGRKIYIKINSDGFTSVRIPNLIEQTLRQAEPSLKAIGLKIGEIKYVPYIGKDMVLKLLQNGKELKTGDKVLKASTIDLEVGDGKEAFKEDEMPLQDTIPATEKNE